MRHVSRTHRVDVDRLYDRINLDPMNQIKYVSTTQKLADILTKRSFTRDRWTRVTLLVNIMTHTKFTQSNMLTSSAVNLLFSSMSKRARASFATWASAKQKPVHCSGPIARKTATRMPSWTNTQYFHQITKLEATPSVKTCVSRFLKESPGRRQEHQARGNWKRLEHQAPGDRLQQKIFKWKESSSSSE